MRPLRWVVLLALTGCTGEVLHRLETDLAALRERVQAREEVRIHVAGPTPTTTSGQLASPTEPHVSVGLPPCPPAVVTVDERPRRHGVWKAKRGRGKRQRG